MKYIANAFLVVSILFASHACAQESASVASAKAAAGSWLALTDAGDYSKGWEQASSLFKAAVSEAGWQNAVRAARSPLGKLKARTFKSATLTHSLPGAPDGEYVVLQYESQFEHKAHAIETVTPMHETDGAWKVTGYFVK